MDSNKFLRWGIPGWLIPVTMLIFIVLDALSANDSLMYETISGIFEASDFIQIIFAAVLVSGAGIPIGFIIYQIYYYLRWSSPFSGKGFRLSFVLAFGQ
jgi:hypothetical protein